MAFWRIFSVSTLDWETKVQVTPSAFPWARALGSNSKGGTAEFKVGDPKVAETATDANLAPWSRMLVAEFSGQIVYAGFIIDTDYDMDTQTTTVVHEDIWAVLRRRLIAGTSKTGELPYTGTSLLQLVRDIVLEANNDAERFNLPIVLPEPSPGALSETYYAYHYPNAADALSDILDTEGGPDLDIFPRWGGVSGEQVTWLMRAGAVNDGAWEWDVTAPKSQASGFRARTDGAKMANRLVGLGEGSEKNMLTSVMDGSAGSTFLPLDATPAYKDESNQTRLDARARADLAARSKPTKQYSMDVQMDADFAVYMLRLGGTVRWKTQGDPWLPDGWRSSRLIEFSGSLSQKIHLEFQTQGA